MSAPNGDCAIALGFGIVDAQYEIRVFQRRAYGWHTSARRHVGAYATRDTPVSKCSAATLPES